MTITMGSRDLIDLINGLKEIQVKDNPTYEEAKTEIALAIPPRIKVREPWNKKVHWSATPEGRKKISRLMKARWAKKRKNGE